MVVGVAFRRRAVILFLANVQLAADDRQTLYGAFLDIAMRMRGDDAANVATLFKRRGARAFADEAEQAAEAEREKVRSRFRQRSDAA